MNTIELARQLGHAIQAEESYKRMEAASAAVDGDEELMGLIEKFGKLRDTADGMTDAKDMEKLDAELGTLYEQIMGNAKMKAFEEAKNEFGALMDRVLAIVTKSADGENPDTAEPDECHGDCCSCHGHDHEHDHNCSCGCEH